MATLEQELNRLNQECIHCMENAHKHYDSIDRTRCMSICSIGRRIHELDVQSRNEWTKVDWNSAKYKEYYHG